MNTELALVGRPPGNPKSLFESDLRDDQTVGNLFCSCAVGDGLIRSVGWQFLVKYHGIERLLAIDAANWEWFTDAEDLLANAMLSGYDPTMDRFGTIYTSTGRFEPTVDSPSLQHAR